MGNGCSSGQSDAARGGEPLAIANWCKVSIAGMSGALAAPPCRTISIAPLVQDVQLPGLSSCNGTLLTQREAAHSAQRAGGSIRHGAPVRRTECSHSRQRKQADGRPTPLPGAHPAVCRARTRSCRQSAGRGRGCQSTCFDRTWERLSAT